MPKSPETNEPEYDGAAIAAKAAAGMGVLFTAAALGLYGGKTGLSVFVGAGLAVANLVSMRALIKRMLPPPDDEEAQDASAKSEASASSNGIDDLEEMAERELAKDEAEERELPKTHREHVEAGKRGGAAWGIFAVLKIVFLFGGIYILLTRQWVDPMPLAAGYGVLPLGIFASAAWGNLAPKKSPKRRKR